MIAYPMGDSLYLNITNRCTNDCVFCIRRNGNGVGGYDLWLPNEPTVDRILQAVGDPGGYSEIVFCGYGEPTCRLDTLVAVGRALRPFGIPLRLNTNGQAELIGGRDPWPELEGIFHAMSISLNAPDAAGYVDLCRPRWGEAAFMAVVDFARKAKKHVHSVTLSAVAFPGVDLPGCHKLAEALGIPLRIREYQASQTDVVGA